MAHGSFTSIDDGLQFLKHRDGHLVDQTDRFGKPEDIDDLAYRISEVSADLLYLQASLQRYRKRP